MLSFLRVTVMHNLILRLTTQLIFVAMEDGKKYIFFKYDAIYMKNKLKKKPCPVLKEESNI